MKGLVSTIDILPQITKVIDESGTEQRWYGKLGETVKEERTVEAKTPPVQRKKFTSEYLFDSFGSMTQMTHPDGEVLTYVYDNGGLPNLKQQQPALYSTPWLFSGRSRTPFGPRRSLSCSNTSE